MDILKLLNRRIKLTLNYKMKKCKETTHLTSMVMFWFSEVEPKTKYKTIEKMCKDIEQLEIEVFETSDRMQDFFQFEVKSKIYFLQDKTVRIGIFKDCSVITAILDKDGKPLIINEKNYNESN